jgi:transposase
VTSPLLSIVPAALEISRVLPTTEKVTIEADLARRAVNCPDCGVPSRRLHSHYPRVLHDLPWQVLPQSPCCRRSQVAKRTRARSSSNPARPYIVRFSILMRLICPSTGLVVHGVASAALIVSKSRRRLAANLANKVPTAAASTSKALDGPPAEQLGQSLCPGDRRIQRRLVGEQTHDEHSLLGVQPRSARSE